MVKIKNLIYFILLLVSVVMLFIAMVFKDSLFFAVAILCIAASFVMLTDNN